jgi:hypothetical protein
MDKSEIRKMLIALLDDREGGVCNKGFGHLQEMFYDEHQDIFDAVECTFDGRVYLPKDFKNINLTNEETRV